MSIYKGSRNKGFGPLSRHIDSASVRNRAASGRKPYRVVYKRWLARRADHPSRKSFLRPFNRSTSEGPLDHKNKEQEQSFLFKPEQRRCQGLPKSYRLTWRIELWFSLFFLSDLYLSPGKLPELQLVF